MRRLRITIGNKSYDVTVEDLTAADSYHPAPATMQANPAQSAPAAATPTPAASRPQLPIEAGAVTSPMAGQIKSILVNEGDSVTKAQPLVILESMKMENQITAPVAGAVKSVAVKEGDAVQENQTLLVLE